MKVKVILMMVVEELPQQLNKINEFNDLQKKLNDLNQSFKISYLYTFL